MKFSWFAVMTLTLLGLSTAFSLWALANSAIAVSTSLRNEKKIQSVIWDMDDNTIILNKNYQTLSDTMKEIQLGLEPLLFLGEELDD